MIEKNNKTVFMVVVPQHNSSNLSARSQRGPLRKPMKHRPEGANLSFLLRILISGMLLAGNWVFFEDTEWTRPETTDSCRSHLFFTLVGFIGVPFLCRFYLLNRWCCGCYGCGTLCKYNWHFCCWTPSLCFFFGFFCYIGHELGVVIIRAVWKKNFSTQIIGC